MKQEFIKRIEVDSSIAFGKPVIKGTRIAVEFILELLGSGWNTEEIVQEYPNITKDDIFACIQYARAIVSESNTSSVVAAK